MQAQEGDGNDQFHGDFSVNISSHPRVQSRLAQGDGKSFDIKEGKNREASVAWFAYCSVLVSKCTT